jgi:nitroimidazol reductase NimA-like FMN-containing flavoprotein (pyridoxamine 5'-phosphate oxidase superfamily)
VTVTVVDGLVLARSVFEHSANYASLIALGTFQPITDPSERHAALEAFTERPLPGRWAEVRAPNTNELRATKILRIHLDEISVKTRTGPPDDGNSPDAKRHTWAGVVPIETRYGTQSPRPDSPTASPSHQA